MKKNRVPWVHWFIVVFLSTVHSRRRIFFVLSTNAMDR
jgi:hypothetical protein